jgi:hypothetical protein
VEENMKKEKEQKTKAGMITGGLLVGVVCAVAFMMAFSNMQSTVYEEEEYTPTWHTIPWVGEYDPGAGNSGILDLFFYEYCASPATNYSTNLTAGDAKTYLYVDADDWNSEIRHTDAWDVVVRVRANKDHCYDSEWNLSRMRMRMNSTSYSLTDSALTAVQVDNNSASDYVYVQFYHQNAGSGFTISLDQTVAFENIYFQVYY